MPKEKGAAQKPKRVKKEKTKDFFGNKKTAGYAFNAAPVDMNESKKRSKEGKELVSTQQKKLKTSFLGRMHDDENLEEFTDIMPTQAGVEQVAKKKRDKKQDGKQESSTGLKVHKLKFSKGSLGLFAISEIHKDYAIVNFTRNKKGFLALPDNLNKQKLQVGQYVTAVIESDGAAKYNSTSGAVNRKLQLTLDLAQINRSLTVETILPKMVIQGLVGQKEAKGYFIDLKLKDKSKAFGAYSGDDLEQGDLIYVKVISATPESKMIKCEIIRNNSVAEQGDKSAISYSKELVFSQVKPGFLVNCKVLANVDNGLKVSFLSGIEGTIFSDHITQSIKSYKVGDKVVARVITADSITKRITLSLKEHLQQFHRAEFPTLSLGQTINRSVVSKLLFGGSYHIYMGDGNLGFLHKTQAAGEGDKNEELTQDQELGKVRIKEFNYFDAMPILSNKQEILESQALEYSSLTPGLDVKGKITEVKEKFIVIALSDFVKGRLYLEHMADVPIKIIPPKLQKVGKSVKLRVFSIDSEKKMLEFTKKESLLKEDLLIHENVTQIQKGAKIHGVIVQKTQYGYQIKTFGGIQGLLTFAEVTKQAQKRDLRVGLFIKSYVLFKKNNKLALTTNKAKFGDEIEKEVKNGNNQNEDNFEEKHLPESMKSVKKSLKKQRLSMHKEEAEEVVGQIYTFKFMNIEGIEDNDNWLIVKAIVEKGGSFAAVLPTCLVARRNRDQIIQNLKEGKAQIQGVVLEIIENVPIVTLSQVAIQALNSKLIPQSDEEMQQVSQAWGFISKVEAKSVSVRFLRGAEVQVKKFEKNSEFSVGQAVRIQKDLKANSFSLLNSVVFQKQEAQKNFYADAAFLSRSAFKEWKLASELALKETELKIANSQSFYVKIAKEQYILVGPDYESNTVTGFVTDDHCLKECQKHKVGEEIFCKVLDIDSEKKVADLSQTLAKQKSQPINQIIKQSSKYPNNDSETAVVELNKENYLIVSLKKSKAMLGFVDLTTSNGTAFSQKYLDIQVGEELQVKVLGKQHSEDAFLLMVPAYSADAVSSIQQVTTQIQRGTLVQGKITSIKGQNAFVRLHQSKLCIGRLHQTECPNFKDLFQGERLRCKVLEVSEDKRDASTTFFELTMKKEHMAAALLDQTQLGIQREQLKIGEEYSAYIVSITPSRSHPVQIALSTSLTGFVAFNHSVEDLESYQDDLTKQFKIGEKYKFTYNGVEKNEMYTFSALSSTRTLQAGSLQLARVVKILPGQGATVQLNDKAYGFLDISEISDDLLPSVLQSLQSKGIFKVRVLSQQKKDQTKWDVSTRHSVVDSGLFKHISPEGKSVNFKKHFKAMEELGNLRNRIVKYGAKSLEVGSLCIGYVSNISKAGCFVKLGKNTVGRAALQELSDEPDFEYATRLPVGMPVIARLTKIEEAQNDVEAPPRLTLSLRESVIKYGLQEGKASQKPKVGDTLTAVIVAKAQDKTFGQIVGSISKIKIKDVSEDTKLSLKELVRCTVTEVENWKIKGTFLEKLESSDEFPQEKVAVNLWTSVQEIQSEELASLAQRKEHKPMEIDQSLLLGQQAVHDQTARQIKDLNDLEQMEADDESMVSVHDGESSEDEREMQRIIKQSKAYEDSEEEDEDSDGEEEGEAESDMSVDESEEEAKEQKKKGLKQHIEEEKKIQLIERKLGQEGEQPQSIDDFERILVANPDQSLVWIQYIAFMLENLDTKAARRTAERAVKSVSISSDQEKLNLWIAFINLENSFGTQESLQKVVKRSLEINDKKKIYMQLLNIYKNSKKYEPIEDILKLLVKKYNFDTDVWRKYFEIIFELNTLKESGEPLLKNVKLTEPKLVLSKCLQVLDKKEHISMISKFGQLEFKNNRPEQGRTMFEGIISNYPKRMDIWTVYLNLEASQGSKQQARTLFEKCLANQQVMKKPHNAKLVFKLFAEFELKNNNQKAVDKIKERAEEYLEEHYGKDQMEED